MRTAIRRAGKARTGKCKEVEPDAVHAPTNCLCLGEVSVPDVSEGRSIAEDRSGVPPEIQFI